MKMKAFVLPDGSVVSCHADVFTDAGFQVEEVERLSKVEWNSCHKDWIARLVGSSPRRVLVQSPLRNECLARERFFVEGLIKSWLMSDGNFKPKLAQLKTMICGSTTANYSAEANGR